ncbi:hypothetical protein GDO78_022080 [Eleutherodactylus coqui]|uniref:Uncharacterized protein n=1 Tax=Eleutherodactylus coqui TaxID=57060 RepID=A0A8J6EMS7_ELECQ|nr:hypothetical protein GDO78_022080 [Eleutherodactylus coqui]
MAVQEGCEWEKETATIYLHAGLVHYQYFHYPLHRVYKVAKPSSLIHSGNATYSSFCNTEGIICSISSALSFCGICHLCHV